MHRKHILQAVRRMILESGKLGEVAYEVQQELGWRGSLRTAEARVSQWLTDTDPHRLPLEAVPTIIRVTQRDYVTPMLQAVLVRAQIERDTAA